MQRYATFSTWPQYWNWILDKALDGFLKHTEDLIARMRRGNAPYNMEVIRHVALNLLKREPTKISVRKKRIRAALNDSFRDKVLLEL